MSAPDRVRVLLLEDNPDDAELVRRQLRRAETMRFEVTHVTSVSSAKAALAQGDFDVVLSDLAVTDSAGARTVEQLTRVAPLTPLVVFTSSVGPDLRRRILELGVQDFLPKQGTEEVDLVRGLTYAVQRGRYFQRLRRLVSDNSDGCLVVSDEGEILFANQVAAAMLGRSAQELTGVPFDAPRTRDERGKIELPATTQHPIVTEMRTVEIDWDGRPARLVSLRDGTDRRRAQELERRLEHADRLASLGSLAAGVAHEINNPTTFIQVNLDAVARESRKLLEDLNRCFAEVRERLPEPERRECEARFRDLKLEGRLGEMEALAEEGLEGVTRVTSIVRTLSSYARSEQESAERVDPNQLVHDAARMVRHDLRHRARFELDLAPVPAIVCDRGKMAQVLVNLLVNAMHALDDEREDDEREDNEVEVRTRFANGEVTISVRDTGRGIAADQLGQIFEPFFTTKRRGHGTGLGLSLSADTVQRHGGRIEVESEVGSGTCFRVILPEETPYLPSFEPKPDTPTPTRAGGRVLLVDDEPLVRRSIVRLLRGRYDVVEAGGGEEALAMLDADPRFDAVLCDLMMPGTDGISLYRALRERHPTLARRTAFITGGVFSARARRFVADAAPLVVEKPVSRAALFSVLLRLLNADSPAGDAP